jgi:hypothetical protein
VCAGEKASVAWAFLLMICSLAGAALAVVYGLTR